MALSKRRQGHPRSMAEGFRSLAKGQKKEPAQKLLAVEDGDHGLKASAAKQSQKLSTRDHKISDYIVRVQVGKLVGNSSVSEAFS